MVLDSKNSLWFGPVDRFLQRSCRLGKSWLWDQGSESESDSMSWHQTILDSLGILCFGTLCGIDPATQSNTINRRGFLLVDFALVTFWACPDLQLI